MGPSKTSPSEAAPAYDEHGFHDEHPVNAFPPSGSASAYATIPQNDERDIELAHDHSAPDLSAPFNPFKPHQHCETCDKFTSAREVRANERHCCLWVAIVFITISVSMAVMGIVAVEAKFRHHKD
ncbi:hypothetical protein CFIO01_04610 [Colletotrichum fioriniae PJ7]|uniref:Uncharacterized protein n=1 Tax=Colletotrichum fioriniae PJ7 TaxID=1445577 RepID=A0A010Q746_9PEZI|nr:hypothetical protein CFIO01_04610 [Colletotrichum fioriniae PJ7]